MEPLIKIQTTLACLMLVTSFALPATSAQPATTTAPLPEARIKLAQDDLQAIGMALRAFNIDNGRFPSTEEGLTGLVTKPTDAVGPATSWPYLKLPVDPWGHPYIYHCPPIVSRADYDLLSAGPDGKEGTADDIVGVLRVPRP